MSHAITQENYKAAMLAGFEAMLQAANEENKSHSGIKTLAQAMHDYLNLAAESFSRAAQVMPTADVQWAIAVKQLLLVREMQATHKIPQ